ncbi:hypothetical protein SBV1_2740003 [Verrucomicrobia bacterium]|nr:hypothetical protein SBV1_2740003 [Verrucomicrobiota bacterium]
MLSGYAVFGALTERCSRTNLLVTIGLEWMPGMRAVCIPGVIAPAPFSVVVSVWLPT